MHITRRDLLSATAATFTLPAFPAVAAVPGPAHAQATGPADAQAAKLLEAIAERNLADFPGSATSLGLDTGVRAALKSRLADTSAAGEQVVAGHVRTALKQLDALPLDRLGPDMRAHVEVVQASYGLAREGFAFPYGDVAVGGWRNSPYVVIQNVGSFLDTPKLLDTDHRIADAADADAYLARLEAYAGQLDGETARLESARALNVIAPDGLCDTALRQLRASAAGDVAGWGLVTSLTRRTKDIKGAWEARAAAIARDRVAPALHRQIAEMERHRARATGDAGVWKLPQGDAYYAWALRAATTTTLSPDEVHRMGLDQTADLQAQMDVILKAQGYTQGSVGQRMAALGQDPRFTYPDNDAGRAQIIELLQARIAHIRTLMPRAFHTLVKGEVEVKRLPLAEEPGAAGAYGGPGSVDGKVPSRLWINLLTTRRWTSYSLPDLAYHEAIPGHGWQGEYTFRLPLIRTLLRFGFSAYGEGWGLYAEQLADELGVYADHPIERLGYLQSLAFRAGRLVVDTGIHSKRWTRAQAVRWLAEANGSSMEEVTGEVDRYCSWPGQACAYKVGHTYINRERDRVKAALGGRYDFRAFNDAVVLGGNVPMTVLSRILDRHIAARRA
jgi:uncharacterized protein (DUF885 family)